MRAEPSANVLEILERNAKLLKETIETSKRLNSNSKWSEEKLKDLEDFIKFLKTDDIKRAYLYLFSAAEILRGQKEPGPNILGSIGIIEAALQVMEELVSDGR